jgi:flagellar basal-body rod protein FlgC
MSFLNSLKISASGLSAQRARMNALSSNLANINTTRTPEGGPYKKKNVVFEATNGGELFGDVFQNKVNGNLKGVKVAEISEDHNAVRLKYDPSHPDANEEGYVALPDINMMKEMVDMLEAKRSYEANVTAMKTARDMALKGLEIGR